ncbi:hypothetical protein ILYODFUR_024840 [Ilyodon furcidens]|uniref:Uncharacterized protein n=1 Tax=Ilyodon furcidens TaxID=33524 RepID=A0ABV0UVY3_9TELE
MLTHLQPPSSVRMGDGFRTLERRWTGRVVNSLTGGSRGRHEHGQVWQTGSLRTEGIKASDVLPVLKEKVAFVSGECLSMLTKPSNKDCKETSVLHSWIFRLNLCIF